jgi:hypothetical protein
MSSSVPEIKLRIGFRRVVRLAAIPAMPTLDASVNDGSTGRRAATSVSRASIDWSRLTSKMTAADSTKTVTAAEIRNRVMIRFYILTFTMRLITNMPITIMTPEIVTISWPNGSSNSTFP